MAALRKTPFTGTITWLGIVKDSSSNLRADTAESLTLTFAGQEGECHAGLTRTSCSRVLEQYPRGTIIRNVRQLSIVSEEELADIAADLGIASIDPRSMGASMVVKGVPDFSHVPPNSRLMTLSGTTVTIGKVVHEDNPHIAHWNEFKPAAAGRRGVTAWVEREGEVRVGDTVELFLPDQRPWRHAGGWALRTLDMNQERRGGEGVVAHMVCMLVAGMLSAMAMLFHSRLVECATVW